MAGARWHNANGVLGAALFASLLIHAVGVSAVSRNLTATADLQNLAIVDVRRARAEMSRIALDRPRKIAGKAAREVKAPHIPLVNPPPRLILTPHRLVAKQPHRPAVAGSQLDDGAGSTAGNIVVPGEGHTDPGSSGAGFGGERGSGVGSGAGEGPAVPNAPPVEEPARPAPAPQKPAPPVPAAPVVAPVFHAEPPPAVAPPPAPTPKVHRPARALPHGPPDYPASARRAGHTGTVIVALTVGADGRTSNVRVQSSSGYRELDDAAVEAVRHWRFSPALDGVDPIPSDALLQVTFQEG